MGHGPKDRLFLDAWGRGWVGPHPSYPQLLLRQVTAVIDATVHGHKALEGRPVPDIGVVEAGVEHDDGEGQDVAGVCGTGQRSQSWPWPLPPPLPQSLPGAKNGPFQCPEGPLCPPGLAFDAWPHLPCLWGSLLQTSFSCQFPSPCVPSHPGTSAPAEPPARHSLLFPFYPLKPSCSLGSSSSPPPHRALPAPLPTLFSAFLELRGCLLLATLFRASSHVTW